MAELVVETPARALAIYAHPDDPDVSCGGTLAVWAKAGCEVHRPPVHRRRKGSSDPVARPRASWSDSGWPRRLPPAALLGVAGQECLNYPDGELSDDAVLREALVAAVRRLRPEVVLCPDPTAVFFGQEYFNHRDHRVTGWAALDAVAPAASLPHYFPDAGPAHQVSTVLLSGTLAARCLGGHLDHRGHQGRGGRLPPEPVPRRRGVGVDGGAAGGRGRRPSGRGGRTPRGSGGCASVGEPAGPRARAAGAGPTSPGVLVQRPERVILHVDMDCLLRLGRGPRRSVPGRAAGHRRRERASRGVVAACTYEARMFGVHSAMPSSVARRLCPDAVFVDGRFHRYVEESRKLHAIFESVTPLVEGISLDEAFLDVTGSRQLLGDGPAIAAHIRRRVADELKLTCSVGVGRSKLMAKLASKAAKPTADRSGIEPGAGVVVVPPEGELAFLHPLPVRALWGVGPVTGRRLEALGIATVGDIAALDPGVARAVPGRSRRAPTWPSWPGATTPARWSPNRRPSRSGTRRPSPRTSGTATNCTGTCCAWWTRRPPRLRGPSWPPGR